MAKNVDLFDNAPHGFHLIIDDHEISDVISYRIEQDFGFNKRRRTLTVIIEVMEEIRINLKEPM